MVNGQRWVSSDYRVTPDGLLAHKRWLNPDRTWKTGAELQKEMLRVELECIARRLIALANEIADVPRP